MTYTFSLPTKSMVLTVHSSNWTKGTNFGLKEHSANIKPTMNMDTSAQTINIQQDIKAAELTEKNI